MAFRTALFRALQEVAVSGGGRADPLTSDARWLFFTESYRNSEQSSRFSDTKAAAVLSFVVVMWTTAGLRASDAFPAIAREPDDRTFYLVALLVPAVPFLISSSISACYALLVLAPRWGSIVLRSKPLPSLRLFWADDLYSEWKSSSHKVHVRARELTRDDVFDDLVSESIKVAGIASKKLSTLRASFRLLWPTIALWIAFVTLSFSSMTSMAWRSETPLTCPNAVPGEPNLSIGGKESSEGLSSTTRIDSRNSTEFVETAGCA